MKNQDSEINKNKNKKKVKNFSINLIPTLNRAIVLSAFIGKAPLTFAVKYDKKSSALQFQLDSENDLIKNRIIQVQMYRNLDTCQFCKLFFDMETKTTESTDIRCKFQGVKPLYARHLIQFLREKYDFQVSEKGKPSQNYMIISGWKLQDADNTLLFYFIQRKCYNDATRTNIVRTAGLQLSTSRGLKFLEKYIDSAGNTIRKVDNYDELPSFNNDEKENQFLSDFDLSEDSCNEEDINSQYYNSSGIDDDDDIEFET